MKNNAYKYGIHLFHALMLLAAPEDTSIKTSIRGMHTPTELDTHLFLIDHSTNRTKKGLKEI